MATRSVVEFYRAHFLIAVHRRFIHTRGHSEVPIGERPPESEDRAVPGQWEGDLIAGSSNSFIANLVERHSRFMMLARVSNKDARSVIATLIKQARKFPTSSTAH